MSLFLCHLHTRSHWCTCLGHQIVLSMLQHARLSPTGITSTAKQIATNTHGTQASRQLAVQHTFSISLPAPFCHYTFAASLKHQYVIASEPSQQRFASFYGRHPRTHLIWSPLLTSWFQYIPSSTSSLSTLNWFPRQELNIYFKAL